MAISFSISSISSFEAKDNKVVLVGPMSPVDSARAILHDIEPKAQLTKLHRISLFDHQQNEKIDCCFRDGPEVGVASILACEMDFGKGVLIFADFGSKLMPMSLDFGDSDGISISPLIKEVSWVKDIGRKADLEKLTQKVFEQAKITHKEYQQITDRINITTKNNKTMATEVFLKSGQVTEDKVKELLSSRIPGDQEEFFKTHAADIQRIIKGQPTGALEFKNHKDDSLYKCRIHGIKEVSGDRSTYLTFNMIYARKELAIGSKLTIGKGVCELGEEQIANLNKWGRLNEPLEFKTPEGDITRRYVAVDKELNRLAFAHENIFRVPEKIWDTQLTEEQRNDLKTGKKIRFEGVKNGEEQKPLKCFYDPVMQTLRFETVYEKKTEIAATQAQNQTQQVRQTQTKEESIGLSSAAGAAVKDATKNKGKQQKSKEQNQHL